MVVQQQHEKEEERHEHDRVFVRHEGSGERHLHPEHDEVPVQPLTGLDAERAHDDPEQHRHVAPTLDDLRHEPDQPEEIPERAHFPERDLEVAACPDTGDERRDGRERRQGHGCRAESRPDADRPGGDTADEPHDDQEDEPELEGVGIHERQRRQVLDIRVERYVLWQPRLDADPEALGILLRHEHEADQGGETIQRPGARDDEQRREPEEPVRKRPPEVERNRAGHDEPGPGDHDRLRDPGGRRRRRVCARHEDLIA